MITGVNREWSVKTFPGKSMTLKMKRKNPIVNVQMELQFGIITQPQENNQNQVASGLKVLIRKPKRIMVLHSQTSGTRAIQALIIRKEIPIHGKVSQLLIVLLRTTIFPLLTKRILRATDVEVERKGAKGKAKPGTTLNRPPMLHLLRTTPRLL